MPSASAIILRLSAELSRILQDEIEGIAAAYFNEIGGDHIIVCRLDCGKREFFPHFPISRTGIR